MQQENSSQQADTDTSNQADQPLDQNQLLEKAVEMMLAGTLVDPDKLEAAMSRVAKRMQAEQRPVPPKPKVVGPGYRRTMEEYEQELRSRGWLSPTPGDTPSTPEPDTPSTSPKSPMDMQSPSTETSTDSPAPTEE